MNLNDLLACPRCAERPGLTTDNDHLVCPVCGSRYPIIHGIPRMIAEAGKTAKEIHEEDEQPPAQGAGAPRAQP